MPVSRVIAFLFAVTCLHQLADANEGLQATANKNIDFSGAWERNYVRSDDIQRKLQSLVREIRRDAERRARSGMQQNRPSAVATENMARDSISSMVALAQMADLVTRSLVLEIEQDRASIRIGREDTFALRCNFHGGAAVSEENPLGRELCGWDQHQLVFHLYLPEGLNIQHRLTLGPAGRKLNIATTVVSRQVSQPFTVNRVFSRFEAGSQGIRCEETITRGKVCTTVRR